MLIATLPPVYRAELLLEIMSCDWVAGVRYNTGIATPYSPKETLKIVVDLARQYNKKLWVDLKGRQLRIIQWSLPDFGRITLNHEIEVEGPARVYFRGAEWSQLKFASGNVIFVDPPPPKAVGAGQSINIIGDEVTIRGYLTDEDVEYIQAACELDIKNFMLSFVESFDDIEAVRRIIRSCPNHPPERNIELRLKLESRAGMDFFRHDLGDMVEEIHHDLVVARDDLCIHLGDDILSIFEFERRAIEYDGNAIVASRLFSSLETDGEVTLADFADLHLLHKMGYRNFLLSDGICNRHFAAAVSAWEKYYTYQLNCDEPGEGGWYD